MRRFSGGGTAATQTWRRRFPRNSARCSLLCRRLPKNTRWTRPISPACRAFIPSTPRATDHIFPETDSVEALIALTKEMEEGDWLHFHCVAGKGRSTALFAVYDILKNPGVPLKDILYRQCMLGGNYMLFQGDGGWKDPYYLGKAEMTQKFYRYIQENHETGYRVRWTAWLAAQGCA